MTFDVNSIIWLLIGGFVMWLLHWLIFRSAGAPADHGHDSHTEHSDHDHLTAELEEARAELAAARAEQESAVASCEEKLADAEAEIASLRADLEAAATVAEPPSGMETLVGNLAAEESMAESAAAPPPAPPTPDDLKKVEGIGPKIEKLLNAAGITTFAKLAGTSIATLERIVREEGGIKVAFPDTWPQQAGLAAAGKWDELERLQDDLKGGRKA